MQLDCFQSLKNSESAPRRRTALPSALTVLTTAALLSACASGTGGGLSQISGPSVTGYSQASVLSRTGHEVSGLDGGRVRVKATGSSATSRDRVEKIALARAAEYGFQQKHKYFQATPADVTIQCGPKHFYRKGEKVGLPPTGYRVATVDVTYAKNAADPAFLPTKDTAERLKAELAADPALSATAVIDPDIASQCGL